MRVAAFTNKQLLKANLSMPYICPICHSSLSLADSSKSYQCANNHHFDIAKEAYLNLLPAQHKKSKEPGDSKEMMRARRDFLEAGFYQPLAKAITQIIEDHHPTNTKLNLLDMGCGEGYYSRQIMTLHQKPDNIELHGIDIAKNAIIAAAKKQKEANFIVASSNNIPYSDAYFDLILRVYAPSNEQEVTRLLKQQGLLLIVTPGPRHLWQLREFIYTEVKAHNTGIGLPAGFEVIHHENLSYQITPNPIQRMALLQMTPFAWKANIDIQEKIKGAKQLNIEVDFILSLAQKN